MPPEPCGTLCSASVTAFARASPIAVPPKPVKWLAESIATPTFSRSVVGDAAICASPAKRTTPTRTFFGTFFRKTCIACWAASRRDGFTSCDSIERETSSTRMTVACSVGTSVWCRGRAMPMQSAASAAVRRTGAANRAHERPPATEASTSRFE